MVGPGHGDPITSTIIGIDCATDPKKVGLALGSLESGVARVQYVQCGSRARLPADVVSHWLSKAPEALLAIDAPLGWPSALGSSLADHEAGEALQVPADLLFHRHTDTEIEGRLNKRPVEVGANLIARTAHAALAFLVDLRRLTGLPIPLAWDRTHNDIARAIEVYPAATLRAHGIEAGEYKGTSEIAGREGLLARLGARVTLPSDLQALQASADALDAVVCLVAGADFLEGRAVPPSDLQIARKEGWIWAPPATEP